MSKQPKNNEVLTLRLIDEDLHDLREVSLELDMSINGILKGLINEFLNDYFEGNSAFVDSKALIDNVLVNVKCNRSKLD